MNGLNFLDEDVPDPTDFPQAAPGLRQLDDALRCSVCRELFFAPVTVNCPSGHCFCSACIRTTTVRTADPVCPLCRESISDTQIRRNQSMEDVVKAWKEARPYVLGLIVTQGSTATSSRSSIIIDNSISNTPRKKRKLDPIETIREEVVEVSVPGRGESLPLSRSSTPVPSPSQVITDPNALVHCPICSALIRNKLVWSHMDKGCPSPTYSESGRATEKQANSVDQKEKWNKVFSGSKASSSHITSRGKGKARASTPTSEDFSEPLPKVSYDTLSAKRVKEMLQEYGLSTHGDKSTMVARHQRWVIMYNANRDASESQRKTLNQLREELRKREENEERRKKVKRKDLDTAAHQETHKTMFAQLTEAARKSGRAPKSVSTVSQIADTTSAIEPASSNLPSSQASLPTEFNAAVIDDADT